MTAYLDDRLFSHGMTDQSTVAEFIEAARVSLNGTGRLLIGLRCDACEVQPEQLDDLLSEPLNRFERLDLISDQPSRVVIDILEHAASCLGQSFELVHEAAEKMTSGACGEAMDVLITCLRTWGQVHEAVVKGGQLLAVDFNELIIEGRPVQAWLAGLLDRLREIKTVVESNDLVLLADMLRYELDETLQEWEGFLRGFIIRVREMQLSEAARNPVVP